MENNKTLKSAVQMKQNVIEYQNELYIEMIQNLQEESKDILKPNLGSDFFKSCAKDIAGEIVRNIFNTADYHITVDQLALRIINFSYEKDYDPIKDNSELQKKIYNINDSVSPLFSSTLDKINQDMLQTMNALEEDGKTPKAKLFKKENGVYTDNALMKKGKENYVKARTNQNGELKDEYTQKNGEYITDKNGNKKRRLEVDHIQAAATAKYDYIRIKKSGIDELKEFYNSDSNFAMMDKVANSSKGDVKVFDDNGNDITHKATPEQLADAISKRWENTKENTRRELIDKGYLNEDGKVPESVKKELESNIRISQNKESIVILKNADYVKISKEAGTYTLNSLHKILIGQFLYYALPPMVYELKIMLSKEDANLNDILEQLPEASKRVKVYIKSNLSLIFKNIGENLLNTFIRSFMDILINMVKATVQQLMKIAKSLVMSTVSAIKIITDSNCSKTEKADAVFNLYGVTITNIIIDLLFEYLNKQIPIPEQILYPIQIVTSIICTNLVMLILKQLDLFDVQAGFKLEKIEALFAEETEKVNILVNSSNQFADEYSNKILTQSKEEIKTIEENLNCFNLKEDSARETLDSINKIFDMGIDFEEDWT